MAHVTNRPVVLIAEDDVWVRNLIRWTLESAGFDILAAANGREALALSREFEGRIDALLADFDMPDVEGPSLIAAIRAERPDTAGLLMSGGHSEGEIDQFGIPVLMKPFPVIDLIKMVDTACSRNRA